MDQSDALNALSALSHQTRLSVFRLLVTTGPDGMPASTIAERLGVLQNTLSTHLGLLSRAGLVTGTREGRVIRYAADFDGMRALMSFLLRDCCAGRPELCAPLIAIAQSCSTASEAERNDHGPPL
jgi:ArsR family transcriptional regulator, arsenate/arsenite/antimonite-responsive transcriptional repressor